jgi:hypothetical protein
MSSHLFWGGAFSPGNKAWIFLLLKIGIDIKVIYVLLGGMDSFAWLGYSAGRATWLGYYSTGRLDFGCCAILNVAWILGLDTGLMGGDTRLGWIQSVSRSWSYGQ